MRRGHSGNGGWRNENPRHFRPRSGGTPHFRPPRSYGLLDSPRFPPPPGPRPHRPPPFNTHPGLLNAPISSQHDRNKYRLVNHNQRPERQDRGHHSHRPMPYQHQRRHDGAEPYKDSSSYYEDVDGEQCLVNSMGDVDHRKLPTQNRSQYNQHRERDNQHSQHTWVNPQSPNKRHYYEDRNYKHYRPDNIAAEINKLPVEYGGHRPPSSDHYDGNPGSANDNSDSFSRSVDDTVDIIRKRLLNRNEPQPLSGSSLSNQDDNDQTTEGTSHSYQNPPQDPPVKKRIQRQKQIVKSNCDKMKNKIVHQLFRMDKAKIHKLMDNPNSSTKFEYAISSLITESQNSFNRHLRSVAEKSLSSSSTEFIENDNNTIYEDTFMKQMQCILDPQDTVFLEDIKPFVMAEISKVLQLDEIEHRFEIPDDHEIYQPEEDMHNYDPYYNEPYNYENRIYDAYMEQDAPQQVPAERSTHIESNQDISKDYQYDQPNVHDSSKPLYERRPPKKSCDYSEERRASIESRRNSRKSLDNKLEDPNKYNDPPLPLFDVNAEQLSEEEDPFAELDNQYHIDVDHNFIAADDSSSPHPSVSSNRSKSPVVKKEMVEISPKSAPSNSNIVKNEIESQLQKFAKSPLKLFSQKKTDNTSDTSSKSRDLQVKQELLQFDPPTHEPVDKALSDTEQRLTDNCYANIKQEQTTETVNIPENIDRSENSNLTVKSSTLPNSRKRSIDQRPSHRKEKRKKSESSPPDTNKQILNKNIIINVNDCAGKNAEKCHEAPKSIFNLYFSKDENNKNTPKDGKKGESIDKYVKRKEVVKKAKAKEAEPKRKDSHNSSSHSISSPLDTSTASNTSTSSQTPNKTDSKTKLKSIDMFLEQPKKLNIHHAHRNTAPTPIVAAKSVEESKSQTQMGRKVTKKHTGTQVIRKVVTKETQTLTSICSTSRFSQTEKRKTVVKAIQTDPVSFEKTGLKATEPFERMKEIDLEIQVLLQEKFKLYSSLESKDSCSNTLQTLGMTVLNVTPFEESKDNNSTDSDSLLSEDAIVDDFTSIPVEELEQIAFESVEMESNTKTGTRSRRYKVLDQERRSSQSPTTRRMAKRAKPPNIDLIEQIITDERPIEDIISLDDLEAPTSSAAKSKKKQVPKKTATKKNKPTKPKIELPVRECSVFLIRQDITPYLNKKGEEYTPSPVIEANTLEDVRPKSKEPFEEPIVFFDDPKVEAEEQIVEETIENDIQFDMLDVSEDIVIGDVCEVKADKDSSNETIDVPISEEIILDNSQSSMEDLVNTDAAQNENICKMYDYSADENLRRDAVIVTGNADAVLAIECIENNFLAACLDGNVYYFSGDGQLLATLKGSNLAVTCLTIVKEKYGTTIYTGSLDSRIRYYDLDTGLEKGPECNVLSPIQTMDRAWDTVFVGTRTGFVLQFECKNNMLIPVSTVKFSDQSILALRAMKEGPRKVLLVASRSESVTVKDAQTGLLLRVLEGPKMTVYTLLYEDNKVYCGTSSHQIHVFDYASGSHVGSHEGGKGAVCLRASGGLLFAGCYDGCVYIYREGECRPLAQLRGPSIMLLSLAIVGTKIIAGYKDRSLYIWKIPLAILQEMIL